MKKVLILFLFLSFGAFAQSVRLEVDTDVFAGAGKEHKMILEVGKEEGATKDNAHQVYIPMRDDLVQDGSNSASNTNFTILSPSSTLPWFDLANSTNSSVVKQTLRVSTLEAKDSYLYAGLLRSDNSELIVINPSSPVLIKANQGIVTLNYYVKIHDLCTIADAGCTPITYNSDDNQKLVITPIIYFFLSEEDDYNVNPIVKLSDVPEGTFFKYALSNWIDLGEDLAVLENLIKGDSRLKVQYSGQKITQMHDVIGIVYEATPTGSEWPQQSYADAVAAGGTINSYDNGIDVPGEFFVKNLTNYNEYYVGVAFVNKWGFATLISESKNQIPETIEAFLETKACYLVSAGFKKEHYVLEYFRDFRDQILLKSMWGKRFVQFYYNTAPKYARIIWHNEILSQIVRFFAYLAYFLMRYFPAIALVLLTGFVIRKLWPYYR